MPEPPHQIDPRGKSDVSRVHPSMSPAISEFRRTGHDVVDWLAEYLGGVEDAPVFPDVEPAALDALFDEPLPVDGIPTDDVIAVLKERLLPYNVRVDHPGYFGLMSSTPAPTGILGDFIAAAINQNVGSYVISPAATALERRTIRWLTDLVGYGPDAGGNLTSGGTLANLIGMKLGRDRATDNRAQHTGVDGTLRAYTSDQRQVSVDKSADMLGIGRDNLVIIPSDDDYRIRVEALEAAIAADRAAGLTPTVIVAIAGTTNTGACDPLPELSAIAKREGLWLHADAAYGGAVLLLENRREQLRGIELADSITLDPHKWFFAPVDAGAVLVRDARQLTESFGLVPPYLEAAPDQYQFYVHGFEQTRRFRALKVWMSFKRYGARTIGAWIEANIRHAERLHALVSAEPDFEPLNAPLMSALCVNYVPSDLAAHQRVARAIEREGHFWISTTVLKDRPAFRVNPLNFNTTDAHIDAFFADLTRLCRTA